MADKSFIYRPMTKGDISQVALLEKECFSSPWSENALHESLINSDYIFMVAESDKKPVGYAGLVQAGDEADITNVAVTSLYRRNGVAFSIMNELFKLAKEKSVKKVFLEVRENNIPAQRLYERLGFVRTGLRKNFYTFPTENAILMEAEI